MIRVQRATILLCVLLTVPLLCPAAPPVGATSSSSRLAFAAYRNGQWDLYSVDEHGTDLRQLTDDTYEDRDPAYSPEGKKLAYPSRREDNWDIYVLDLSTGRQMRLTDDPAYDGAPAWSPDGTRIAFESARAGVLHIWAVDAAGTGLKNLTGNSPSGDFAPAWSPDGNRIAFTSWRMGDKDLFVQDLADGSLTQLTKDGVAEEWPAWRPDGRQIAFVHNRLGEREVYLMDVAAGGAPPAAITWFGRDDAPAWSPDSDRIAFLNHRYDGERLMVRAVGAPTDLPVPLTGVGWLEGRPTWSKQAIDYGTPAETLANSGPSPIYTEHVTPSQSGDGEPWDLVEVRGIQLPTPAMTPYLSDRVNESFLALRRRLADEVGYDYLSNLSEAYRPYQYRGDTSEYASWHKSGRAIDSLFDFNGSDGQTLEIARDDMAGVTYWRVYLRCTDQSGACGRPLTVNTWDYSYQARAVIAPDEGGIEKPILGSYYVDLTALMCEYGWERISSWNTEDFSWTWHFKGFEYWHFQKTEGMTWYSAMREVIAPDKIEAAFTYAHMLELGDQPYRIATKGVPLPARARLWWSRIQQ